MSIAADISFDGQEEDMPDVNTVISGSEIDDHDSSIPIKRLENAFETIAKTEPNSTADGKTNSLRVFLRVRPISTKLENTISIESDTSIVSSAPVISNRAKYTKLEERCYTFNRVFAPSANQEEVFAYAVEPQMDRYLLSKFILHPFVLSVYT